MKRAGLAAAKMILRDRCSTSYDSYDLASLFVGSAILSTDVEKSQDACHGAVSSALNFSLSNEVSQNCLVSAVVK